MFSKELYSPLRYPGGKAAFAPFIAKIIQQNNLCGGHYFEPYAGGAGVALNLLFNGYAGHIHINDVDPAIYAFWISATKYPDRLLKLLNSTPITMEEWFKWRSILLSSNKVSIVEKGFATLFMNRTNRSGILNAGVIGGKSQSGDYKLDARFDKDKVAERIKKISKYKKNISVYGEDALHLLSRCSNFLEKKSLIYLDPPYYLKGKGLYRNYYDHNDHAKIAQKIQNKNFKWRWVASYDFVDEILDMYQFSQSLQYGLNYTAQRKYVGSEAMFFSNNICVPDQLIPQMKLCIG
jgi:DNA adenine methylase